MNKFFLMVVSVVLLSLASTQAMSAPVCKFIGHQPTKKEQIQANDLVWTMVFLSKEAGMTFGSDSKKWECSSSSLTFNTHISDGAGNSLTLNLDTKIMAHIPAGRFGHVMCFDVIAKKRFTPGADGKCFKARDPFKARRP